VRRLERIQIEIPNQVIRQFKKQARDAFPKETFAYLIGRDAGTVVEIESLFIPEGLDSHCTPASVAMQMHWPVDAREFAADDSAEVVGTIHSHPYTFEESGGCRLDRGLSESDHEALRGQGISGICTVQQAKSGRLSASIRFWGPTIPVDTVIKKR
jgi:hypothetical protein